MTSKKRVLNTLEGKNKEVAARQIWVLPWAENNYGNDVKKLLEQFPNDIVGSFAPLNEPFKMLKGNIHEIGEYIDPWGCKFKNITRGIIGEVKAPMVIGDEWEDSDNVHIPYEMLNFNIEDANEWNNKNASDKFVLSQCFPRPFEQLQFIRGTEQLYMDLLEQPQNFLKFKDKMHAFYCDVLEKWAKTNVDALFIMDDWGSQKSLLINPTLWSQLFMPMYKDYIDIAHRAGKKIFMHSDGYILDIIPKLIDLGLDAINSQLFCMGFDKLAQFKGKITFWGEMDRQNLLPYGTAKDIDNAVKQVYDTLYDDGYAIAQCEFGVGAKPENVFQVFDSWNKFTTK